MAPTTMPAPLAPSAIVPELVMPPENAEMLVVEMPTPLPPGAEIVLLLTMPPAGRRWRGTRVMTAMPLRPAATAGAVDDAAGKGREAVDEDTADTGGRRDETGIGDVAGEDRAGADEMAPKPAEIGCG